MASRTAQRALAVDGGDAFDGEAERDARALAELDAHLDGSAPQPSLGALARPMVDVAALRDRLGMSQRQFSEAFGFSTRTVQNWEQKRRLPDRSARILLQVIENDPETVSRIARSVG